MAETIPESAPWTHVGGLGDHVTYQKPFLRDRLQPLPDVGRRSSDVVVESSGARPDESSASTRKLQLIEKSMEYLRNEHQATLSSLQKEIERLKRENNETKFKLIIMQHDMTEYSSVGKPDEKLVTFAEHKQDKSNIRTISQEITDLKHSIEEQKQRNRSLQEIFDQQAVEIESLHAGCSNTRDNDVPTDCDEYPVEIDLGRVKVVSDPLRVQLLEEMSLRQPNFSECEALIKLVLSTNIRLEEELHRLRMTVEPVDQSTGNWLYPTATHSGPGSRLPGLNRPPPNRRLLPLRNSPQASARSVRSTSTDQDICIEVQPGSLPPLRQHLGTHVAVRRRRMQELQKKRLENIKK